MDPHERARKLVALATDKGASQEEARTAAMTACRLIARHKMLDASASHGNGTARRHPGAARSASHENGHARREAPRDEGRRAEDRDVSYRAARAGVCAFCATPFGPEDDVMTYPQGAVDHWHCAKRRAAGAEPGI
jgi:hypothetical protein